MRTSLIVVVGMLMWTGCERAETVIPGSGGGAPPTPIDLTISAPAEGYKLVLTWTNSDSENALDALVVRVTGNINDCSVTNPEPESAYLIDVDGVIPGESQVLEDDHNLEEGVEYCYVVFARAGDLLSANGLAATGTPHDVTPPEAVGGLSATFSDVLGEQGIQLSWTLPADDHLDRIVFARREGEPPQSLGDPLAVLISVEPGTDEIQPPEAYADLSALDGVEYFYRAWTVDDVELVSLAFAETSATRLPVQDDDGDGFTEADGDCVDSSDLDGHLYYPDADSDHCMAEDWDCNGLVWEESYCQLEAGVDLDCTAQNPECIEGQGCDLHIANDMILCDTGEADFDYNVCVDGVCVSPGSTYAHQLWNVSGPYFVLPPSVGHTDLTREILSGDPVVTDNVTGLMWQGCAAGQSGDACTGVATIHSWQDSFVVCDDLSWGGFDDWFLPGFNGLLSIVDYGLSGPALDPILFPQTPTDRFWSSPLHRPGPDGLAFLVDFDRGLIDVTNIPNQLHVRCVRRTFTLPVVEQRRYEISEPVEAQEVVQDHVTGLMWQRCIDGTIVPGCGGPSGTPFDWQSAVNHCETMVFAEYGDWRLPEVKELGSITSVRRGHDPFTDIDVFPSDIRYQRLWSATVSNLDSEYAWVTHSESGEGELKARALNAIVQCVRGPE